MCVIIETTYGCNPSHKTEELQKCEAKKSTERTQGRRGIFSSLFCSVPRTLKHCEGTERAVGRTSRFCDRCQRQNESQRRAQGGSSRFENPVPRRDQGNALSECFANTPPRRPVRHRAPPPIFDYRPSRYERREPRRPAQLTVKTRSSIEEARQAARGAAREYGWKLTRGSRNLEPELVQGFLIQGGDLGELSRPNARTHFQEPGIDFESWDRFARPGHGFYPPPLSPPPSRGLPPLPGRSLTHHHHQPSRSESRREPTRATSSRRQSPQREVVSPLSSPLEQGQRWSPVSPVSHSPPRFQEAPRRYQRQLHTVASRLDRDVESLINSVESWGVGDELGFDGPRLYRAPTHAEYAPAPLKPGRREGSQRRRE